MSSTEAYSYYCEIYFVLVTLAYMSLNAINFLFANRGISFGAHPLCSSVSTFAVWIITRMGEVDLMLY